MAYGYPEGDERKLERSLMGTVTRSAPPPTSARREGEGRKRAGAAQDGGNHG